MQVSRRSMLKMMGGTAAAAALSPSVAACSKSASKNSTAANTKVKLPTYIAYTGVKPDLTGDAAGVLPAFDKYPANPVKASSRTPGHGGSVNAFANIYAAVPPPLGRNAYWKQLNKRLGINLQINMIPAADYADKLATMVAGNSLPDLASLSFTDTPSLPGLLGSKFAELGEFLGGDAVKDYPFLANIPTSSWRRMVYNGGIYGVPIPRSPIGTIMFVRDDIVKQKGLNLEPKSFADFRELCKGLTDNRANKFAIGRADTILGFIQAMLGKPNTWVESGGKFTNVLELDETRKAIDAVHTLYKDGSFHPDSFTTTTVQAKQWVFSGTVALNRDGYKGWSTDILGTMKDREHRLGAMIEPGFDGGKGSHAEGNSSYGLVGIKKADKARVKQILAVCNWLAAPFGTEEYLARKFGVAGTDYTLHGSDPVLTSKGTGETALPVNYLVDAPDVIYDPGEPALAAKQHDFFQKQIPLIVPDPVVGLYSNTDSSHGASLGKAITTMQMQVFQGRKSLKDWDEAVKTWRSNGGNTIKDEYGKAYEQLHGH